MLQRAVKGRFRFPAGAGLAIFSVLSFFFCTGTTTAISQITAGIDRSDKSAPVISFSDRTLRPAYQLYNWTADSGLPQNTVHDILQTSDGYLWLATGDGLVRFDGVRFTVFNKGNSPEIPVNRFMALYEDPNKLLWSITENGSLVRNAFGVFTNFQPLDSVNFWDFVRSDPEGDPATGLNKLRMLRVKNSRVELWDASSTPGKGLPSQKAYELPCDRATGETGPSCYAGGGWLSIGTAEHKPDLQNSGPIQAADGS